MNALQTTRVTVLALLLLASSYVCAQQGNTGSGVINASLMNKSGITLLFRSTPDGVSLGSAGTSAASLDFGNVAMYMTTPPPGVTLNRAAQSFTVSSTFAIYVDIAGMTSPSYSLTGTLGSAPGVYTFSVDNKALSAAALTIGTADPYQVDVPHTLAITIPATAPAGSVSNTINFVATSN